MPDVVIFTQPNCPPCRQVKNWFAAKGVDYIEKDVTSDPEALRDLRDLGFKGTPAIVTSTGSWVGVNLEKMKELL